jgi:excisionase family DNA binding protein
MSEREAARRAAQSRMTLTVQETAQRLGIGRNQAYEAIQRGEIPHIKIGKRILVPEAAFARMLNSAA